MTDADLAALAMEAAAKRRDAARRVRPAAAIVLALFMRAIGVSGGVLFC